MNPTMPDLITAGVKMIAALGVVLGMIVLLMAVIRKLSSHRIGMASGKRIQVLESHYMGVKKSISLVRVPGKVLVLGISGDRINLLDTLVEPVEDGGGGQPMTDSEPKSFAPFLTDQLKNMGSKLKGKRDR
jgi:flagellar protein FliO/FliZ